MRADGPQTPYEVYCYQCHVTFPAGTRRCIHCGGRLSRKGGSIPDVSTNFDEAAAPYEEENPRTSPFSPLAVLGVLLAVAGTLYRACAS